MQVRDIRDLIPFLGLLREQRIWFRLDHLRDDAVMASIHMVGTRLEVEFFADHVEYSVFEGDESVHDDMDKLLALIEERGK